MRAFAGEPRRIALQRRQPADLHQMLIVQAANADQFLVHQRDFLVLGLLLRQQAGDLLVQLRDALAQLRLLPGPAGGANLEQFGFARHHVLDVGIVGAIEQRRRKYDLVEALLFGLQPRRRAPASRRDSW